LSSLTRGREYDGLTPSQWSIASEVSNYGTGCSHSQRNGLVDADEEGCARFAYRVHGFCLMTNHVHLALQSGDKPLSRGMQNLSFR